jgi:hypothetical protein
VKPLFTTVILVEQSACAARAGLQMGCVANVVASIYTVIIVELGLWDKAEH